jgi:hypothetical protein
MAKKVVLDEAVLRQQLTGAVPIFIPSAPAVQEPPAEAKAAPPAAQESQLQPTGAGEKESDAPVGEKILELKPAKAEQEGEDKDLQRYEKAYLHRNLIGLPRTNVGVSVETLRKVEQVVNRLFDGRIAVSTFVDNVVFDHLVKNEKQYNRWLLEKSSAIF